MSEQEIKSLLYKDMQRYKTLTTRVEALEKQVLLMHDFVKNMSQQVINIGEALTKLATIGESENGSSN
jgi:uncharacterized Rmd1/YagE family protein